MDNLSHLLQIGSCLKRVLCHCHLPKKRKTEENNTHTHTHTPMFKILKYMNKIAWLGIFGGLNEPLFNGAIHHFINLEIISQTICFFWIQTEIRNF